MQTPLRVLLIALVAPALAHLAAAVVLVAPLLLFTFPVSYPACVLVAGVALSALHALFSFGAQQPKQQFWIVLAGSAVLGLLVHVVLAWAVTFSAVLAALYAAFGIVNGVVCWALYNWGPLRVRRVIVAQRSMS